MIMTPNLYRPVSEILLRVLDGREGVLFRNVFELWNCSSRMMQIPHQSLVHSRDLGPVLPLRGQSLQQPKIVSADDWKQPIELFA